MYFLTVKATLSGSSQLTSVNMFPWAPSDEGRSPAIFIFLSHNENHIAGSPGIHFGILSLAKSVMLTCSLELSSAVVQLSSDPGLALVNWPLLFRRFLAAAFCRLLVGLVPASVLD